MHDLAIECGRISDPANQIDGPGVVSIHNGLISSVVVDSSNASTLEAKQIQRRPDEILLPGLIDIHAHPAVSGSIFGTAPDETMLSRGVTAVMSQGDVGANGIDAYVESTIQDSQTVVRLAINLSRIGEATQTGCFDDLQDIDIGACVEAIHRHAAVVPAIAVNVSHHACGQNDPQEILRVGLEVAAQTNRPILFGMRRPEDWSLAEQLELLRPGDIVTYCFRRQPHCIVENNRVLPCVVEAQRRGVKFDVGHGMGSFSFDVAERAIGDGFLPDTISTDHQSSHLTSAQNLPHDLPLVMSKLRAAGMSETDIFSAVTATPARLIDFGKGAGHLTPGAVARLTFLKETEPVDLFDVDMNRRQGTLWCASSGSLI